jgi:hypothetical protein
MASIKSFVEAKIDEFVVELNGRFREHVSDTFLKAYLIRSFEEEYRKARERKKSVNFVDVAYKSSVYLFEIVLIYGCKMNGNGHHLATDFGNVFKDFEQKYSSNFNDEDVVKN